VIFSTQGCSYFQKLTLNGGAFGLYLPFFPEAFAFLSFSIFFQSHASCKRLSCESLVSVPHEQPPCKQARSIQEPVTVASSEAASMHEPPPYPEIEKLATAGLQPTTVNNLLSHVLCRTADESISLSTAGSYQKPYCSLAQTLVPIMQSAKAHSHARGNAAKTQTSWSNVVGAMSASSDWIGKVHPALLTNSGRMVQEYPSCLEIRNAAFSMTRKYLIRSTTSPSNEVRNSHSLANQQSCFTQFPCSRDTLGQAKQPSYEPERCHDENKNVECNLSSTLLGIPDGIQLPTHSHLLPARSSNVFPGKGYTAVGKF